MKVKNLLNFFFVVHSKVNLSQSAIFHLQRGKAIQKVKRPAIEGKCFEKQNACR
jgi:hypothetical protein